MHQNALKPDRTGGAWAPARMAAPVEFRPGVEAAPPWRELWDVLWNGWWLLGLAALAGIALGLVYAARTAPVYRATAMIEVQDLNENFMNLKDVASAAAAPPVVNDLQTQLRILQSATLISRVVARAGMPGQAGPLAVAPTDGQVEAAAKGLQVRESRQSRIVDLAYESADPRYAALFLNQLGQQYIDQNVEARLEISRSTSIWLERQLEEMRAKLTESERRLQAYANKSGLLVTNAEERPDEEKLRQVQANLSKAQENRMVKQARWEMAKLARPDSLDHPLGSALRDHQAKLADLRRQRADLLAVYTPEFAAVKRLDAQIGDLEGTVRKEQNAVLEGVRNDYADATRRETLLQRSYEAQVRQVAGKANSAIQFGILKHEVESNRELYNGMLHKAAEAKVATALRASNARFVDRARIPQRPVRPSRLLSVLTGGTVGLLCGLVLVTARSRFGPNAGVAPRADVLQVPELGPLPEKPALAAEGYRAILAAILSGPAGAAPLRVVSVTSACAGEGKSELVEQLAATLAQMKWRVLLVDATRNGTLQKRFGGMREYGLRDLVESPGALRELLPYITHPTPLAGVDLAALGPHETEDLDAKFAHSLTQLLEEIRGVYDIVLVDTPALLELPDARLFAKLSGGVVLAVRAGKSSPDAVSTVVRRLQWDGSTVLGTVTAHGGGAPAGI